TRLPAYMIPAFFEYTDSVPRLVSGKINRKALAQMPVHTRPDAGLASDEPQNDAQKTLFEVLRTLFPGQEIHLQADFFSDMGGHSLLAAQLVSLVRGVPRFAALTVQDVYQKRTVQAIAECMQRADTQQSATQAPLPFAPSPNNAWRRRLACGIAQFAAVPFLITLSIMQWLAPFFTYHNLTGEMADSTWYAIAMSFIVFIAV